MYKHEARPDLCQWFYLCENPATRTRRHPALGDVPICERCNHLVGPDDDDQ